jgi:hypothetical protein
VTDLAVVLANPVTHRWFSEHKTLFAGQRQGQIVEMLRTIESNLSDPESDEEVLYRAFAAATDVPYIPSAASKPINAEDALYAQWAASQGFG